jgi:uroporphyrinogen decarboxylase
VSLFTTTWMRGSERDLLGFWGLDADEGDEELKSAPLYCALAEELQLDWIEEGPGRGFEHIGESLVRDRYGVVYRQSEHGMAVVIDGPIKEQSDLRGFDMTLEIQPDDSAILQYMIERLGDARVVSMGAGGPFTRSWFLRGGMQTLLLDYMLDPSMVHALARVATDYAHALIERASSMNIRVFSILEDISSENAPLMSIQHFREYIMPYLKEMIDAAHREGMKVNFHSDGILWPFLGDLLDIEIDSLNPIQPQCMDIGEMKERTVGKLCLIGNIDCRELPVNGTGEDVEEAVKQTINVAAPGGGYILASSNSIHPGVRPENALAMFRTTREYGVYA